MRIVRSSRLALAAALLALAACAGDTTAVSTDTAATAPDTTSDATGDTTAGPTQMAKDGALSVEVVVPEGAGVGLKDAAADLTLAMRTITGATADATTAAAAIVAVVDPKADKALTDQGYLLTTGPLPDGRAGVTVTARTEIGAMYGLYHVASLLGARYIHPEETFYPSDPAATLPTLPEGPQVPRFERRGFHEHTQHPIPMSDFLLRPGDPEFRAALSRYALWMARNRQNLLFFHSLKTIDLDTWIPYMADFIDEAHGRGLRVGTVIGFADQQQNAFKLLMDDAKDPETGAPLADDVQIRAGIDRLLEAGFDELGFQIGTSEFTKPEDAKTLGWIEAAVSHLRANHPNVRPQAWIHITCSLESDSGGYYYHLPLQSDPDLGAFVHTTMFYTLHHPAPVYDCEDFHHQRDFLDAADGTRELTFFPESAWWLGFDNNMPLVLPITGWSREWDVREELAGRKVSGHVTFTTGREWTYWQYDHYLTELTWSGTATWESYVRSLAPLYGAQGEAVGEALVAWTELQKAHLYEDNPLIVFYLAGELLQDEIGAQAGILARRPKIAFQTVLAYDDAQLEAWKTKDLDMLKRMLGEYGAALQPLPETLTEGTEQQIRLYREVRSALYVTVRRLEHVIALYEGVVAARAGDRDEAEARLATARTITTEMTALFVAAEKDYRYPVEILARPKPETLTSYPFGYLSETSTGHFWARRDDQLKDLITLVFEGGAESWSAPPAIVWPTTEGAITMLEPSNALAGAVLAGFVPRMLFAPETANGGALTVHVAQDANKNGLPDAGTELAVAGTLTGGAFEGQAETYGIVARDAAGALIGTLPIEQPVFRLDLTMDGDVPKAAASAAIEGQVASEALIALVMTVGGIDREGTENLLKGVYGIEATDPVPEKLPMHIVLPLDPPL